MSLKQVYRDSAVPLQYVLVVSSFQLQQDFDGLRKGSQMDLLSFS